ncbi:MAG: helix-turn-helix domain-containing protein [Egibacteraceae bacterium]
MDENTPVGQRIAYYRRRRGLTQQVLSGLVGRSVPWLSLIERGDRTVQAIADLLALARVLKVEPSDLIGGLSLPANGGAPHDPPQGISAIRRAVLAGLPGDREPPSAAELRANVDQAGALAAGGSYEARALLLPHLVVAGRAAAEEGVPGAWGCLARVYLMTSGLVRTFGDVTLAWIGADRAIAAAKRSGDDLLVAHARRRMAFALMREGWLDKAGAVCSDSGDALAPTDAAPLEQWSLWGSLQLTQAVIAVRGGDGAYAWRLLRDARTAAQRVGPGRNDYWENFGPANVGAHEVAVALESGDAREALRLADHIDIDELPMAQRRAEVLIDVAQAHGLLQDDAATVALLLEAERHAPETIRYSVLARELVRVCLGRERRSRTPGLRGLAERLGITR